MPPLQGRSASLQAPRTSAIAAVQSIAARSSAHSPSPASAEGQKAAVAVAYNPELNIPTQYAQRGVKQHWQAVDMANTLQNDLSQYFVTTGNRPQNFLLQTQTDATADGDSAAVSSGSGASVSGNVDALYCGDPDIAEFTRLQRQLVDQFNALQPYMAHRVDLRHVLQGSQLQNLLGGYEFDVIVVDPPWKEYEERAVGVPEAERAESVWTYEELARLPISSIAAEPCVLFLWCGSGPHLQEGHQLLSAWGFRQVEDVCWLQTNKQHPKRKGYLPENAIWQRSHEHCLMGLKGDQFILRDRGNVLPASQRMEQGLVRFLHPGSDIDVIVSESPDIGSTQKPVELYELIERFCIGRRRLELFGSEHNVRHGWLTLGSAISPTMDNFNIDRYKSCFEVYPVREAAEDGSSPAEWLTAEAPSTAALQLRDTRDAADWQHGRFDARLFHYLPHVPEIHERRQRSPERGAPRPQLTPNGIPRRVFNAGRTAGITALEAQMQQAHMVAKGFRPPKLLPNGRAHTHHSRSRYTQSHGGNGQVTTTGESRRALSPQPRFESYGQSI
jgi:N6-adenosine-specific RNA methylase IME4